MMAEHRIAVLGAGAWGLTLADLLAGKGCHVVVWDIDTARLEFLRRDRVPGKPPGLRVPDSVGFEPDFSAAADCADIIVSVVPSFAVRSVFGRLRDTRRGLGARLFVSCSKGIEEGSLLLPSQIFEEFFGGSVMSCYAALSGPSHAEEVCRGIPTVVVSASPEIRTAERARDLFMSPAFRVYTQNDVKGVELGAALKNVIAIAAGICDGLGFGDNTKAALITRGLAEIARAAVAMGAEAQTLSGLAGLGDLVVTAMSRHSRNRLFGELLAQGRGVEQALSEVGAVVEGFRTSRSAHDLAKLMCIDMPLCDAVYAVAHKGLDVAAARDMLLARDPKPEIY
ncbi:MAG: NAD(P)H-dependent glycerol-3-phosphate dehydrogenase [bacterium]